MNKIIDAYKQKIEFCLTSNSINLAQTLAESMREAWKNNKNIYFCGNGGSAGNATHLANDFLYGAGIKNGIGLRVESLSANTSIITCLGNDIGYENIYSEQLRVKANKDDILICLSGSGNSPNILNALEMGNKLGMETFAILGFSGGKAKNIAKYPIHFEINDMQVSEDLQMIVGHMCMQYLYSNPVNDNN
jgi:D-sedoheptulose 7-phosphate isomerase